jgi:aspartyl protease
MIFPYHPYEVLPNPGRNEGLLYRPMVPVRVHGPKGTQIILGLVDTGSDVTVLPSFLLPLIGAGTGTLPEAHFRGVGGQVVTARYSRVDLSLDHPAGLYRWAAPLAFLDGRDVAILGHTGFLEYFQATFDSVRRRLTLKPNSRFPGTVKS